MESAITAPTPSTSANSCTDADRIPSIEPNLFASACADVGPTCLIDSATNTRHSGLDFAVSNPIMNRSEIAPNVPSFFKKNCDLARSFSVSENRSPSSFTKPSANSAAAASYPRTSISKALREPI